MTLNRIVSLLALFACFTGNGFLDPGCIPFPSAVAQKQDASQLIAELKSPDEKRREEAAKALGQMKAAEARDPLIAALKDRVSNVRSAAATALGRLGDAAAIVPLIALLRDTEYFVRDDASGALAEIGQSAIAPLVQLLGDRNADVREGATDALSKIGEPALDALIEALKSPNPAVRRSAADAMSDLYDERKTAAFEAALKAKDLAVIAGAYDYFADESEDGAPESLVIAALNAYGTQAMAEYLLDSDSRRIRAAVKSWAARHGCRSVAYLTTSGLRSGLDCSRRRGR